ncbi:MAG: heavy metal-associated domain-containing protein [Erysipelotrichaceae bacterium]|nr:heavy metal-associated domain-containing protein [Erysipelotrichaceae bacterium]
MKKRFDLINLGCANCAAKMEDKISKLAGVESCVISFMNARLSINAEAEDFERILVEAQEIVSSIEHDCYIKY